MLRRAGVAAFVLATAGVLAWALPTNKNLPCPYCQVSSLVGWVYMLAWTVSFYPQLLVNYRRKSVAGLSLDFTVMNIVGFACYTVFNLALFYSPVVRAEYTARFGAAGGIPVELNDVLFGLHALLLSAALGLQCLLYPRAPGQRVSLGTSLTLGGALAAGGAYAAFLGLRGEARDPFTWLDLCYYASAVKMGVTLVKYVPQVHLNRSRRSTDGWSIDNVALDFTGGLLSVAQLLVSCYVLHDWSAVTGNPIKFGLGFVSIGFDIVFLVQHALYKERPLPAALKQQQQQQQQPHTIVVSAGADSDSDTSEAAPLVAPAGSRSQPLPVPQHTRS